jgi:hypothetical protein
MKKKMILPEQEVTAFLTINTKNIQQKKKDNQF